ncbi:hypothetical protein AVEN_44427-1 [Araneus ventricosus]|uniref:DUF4817 domain-containing protein n=1 Tax=Araneus ventricosus TaxID=182803 RepID=A0A4Y2VIS0_ARAVE|nr:hypothetical protein AVEN_44427-1 [Araneus ventricosus]
MCPSGGVSKEICDRVQAEAIGRKTCRECSACWDFLSMRILTVVHFSLKTSKYSVFERISIVEVYYSSNSSPIAAQRKFATEYKLKTTGPSVITIKNRIEKFERTSSVDVSTFQRFLQNFHLRHVIAIYGKHNEHVLN